jgi:hypothetical protein
LPHTLRQLETLRGQIEQDAEAAVFDGAFNFRGVSIDQAAGTVVVRLITARPDHAASFAARYGPLVRTEVIGDRVECAGSYYPS